MTRLLLAIVMSVAAGTAQAQPVPASPEARPRGEPASQTSVPSGAPAADTTRTTGAPPKDPAVKQMNDAEKAKVDAEGK